jgi:hypothetical protein
MPLGPYKTFDECILAQKQKGKDDLSARKICGELEKNTEQGLKQASASMKYEDDNGHLYIKAFLLSSDVNINQWGISPNSLDQRINTFIGKPLVLTETFNHPLPPESLRKGGNEQYDNDNDPTNTVNVDDIVDHWLQFQEPYRVGNIIDITEKKGTYYAIIEVTDPAAKDAFRNNEVPLFVSPAIAQLDPFEDPTNITQWTGIHLAIVADPAYTIKKALISGQCHGETERCVLQLRQAAVQRKEIPRIGCGFCRTKALVRYAEVVKHWRTDHWVPVRSTAKDLHEFTNSSIEFSKPQLETELTDQQNNNQNTTTDTNKPQEFEQKQDEQGGDLGEQRQKGNPRESIKTTKETEESTQVTKEAAAKEISLKIAGMPECIQIFQQNGVQDPQQAEQICKLAAQALMDKQEQQNPNAPPGAAPGGGYKPGGPPRSPGQFGSVTEYEKELAKYEARVADLTEQLKTYKKGDKTDAQRIAELEDQVTDISKKYKEKELEAYLVTKIADEDLRNKKIKRFAELNLSIDDVKDIYPHTEAPKAGNIKKVAEVQQQESPISRVKLQVASTNSEESQSAENKIANETRERNNRIVSSLLLKGGYN